MIETIARIEGFGNIGWAKNGNALLVITSAGNQIGQVHRPGPKSNWEYNVNLTVRTASAVNTLVLTGNVTTRKEAKGLIEKGVREWSIVTNRLLAATKKPS
jgi:hypothetical protein